MPKIKRLRMSEVSGVDYPAHLANGFSVQKAADPDKSVAFLKALGRGIAMPTDEKIVKSLADATPEDIAEVAKAFTDEQKSEIAKALGVEAAPVSPEEALLKSLAPEAREVFKSLQAEVEKSAREASIEKARRLDTEAIAKSREDYQHLGFDHETSPRRSGRWPRPTPRPLRRSWVLKAADAQVEARPSS
jgi:uncharacterized protein YdiU (UPF0061 family)